VVARLDRDNVGHKVGAEQQCDRLDDVRRLGLGAGQREHGEVLVGAELKKI
jgi:hypothetical protein